MIGNYRTLSNPLPKNIAYLILLSSICKFSFKLKEDVEEFMKKEESAESALKKIDEQYQKYKFMESNLIQKKMR